MIIYVYMHAYVCINIYFDLQTVHLRIINKFEIHIRKNQACDTFLHLFSESNVAGTLFWWHCSAIGSSATFHTQKVSVHVSTYIKYTWQGMYMYMLVMMHT